jgi:hypothetical protein
MPKALWELVRMALQTSGLDPQANMAMIGERLNSLQYSIVEMFLIWLQETGKTVGDANYRKVFNEFLKENEAKVNALV